MEPSSEDVDSADDDKRHRTGGGANISTWRLLQRGYSRDRPRRSARQVLTGIKAGVGRVKRHQPRTSVFGNRHERAVSAISIATMLAFVPPCKPLASFDRRLAKHILLPNLRSKSTEDEPVPMEFRSPSPIESRRLRERDDPCSFRTRLADPVADPEADIEFESSDKLDGENFKFDDAKCISVGRSVGKFRGMPRVPTSQGYEHEQTSTFGGGTAGGRRPHLYSVPSGMPGPEKEERLEPTTPCSSNTYKPPPTPVGEAHPGAIITHKALGDPMTAYHGPPPNHKDSDDEAGGGSMETMNMPFWDLPSGRRPKRHTHHIGDPIPDDMSIISDISLIPTYLPTDATGQQRPHRRALIKHILRVNARAAGRTMRQLKRSCRDVVGNVFVERATRRHLECISVGAT